MLCLGFANVPLCSMAKQSLLWSCLSKGHCSRSLVDCTDAMCKLQLYCYVPFRGMRLSLGAFSKQAIHVQAHSEQDRGIVLTHAGTIQNNKLPKVVRFFDD